MYDEFGDAQQRRLYRGAHHVFYLNGIHVVRDCLTFEVFSAGSGNQYDVQIDAHRGLSCSCPDHRHNGTPLCKHMVFVLSRRLAIQSLPIPPAGAGHGYKIRFTEKEFEGFYQTTVALQRVPLDQVPVGVGSAAAAGGASKFTHEVVDLTKDQPPKGVQYAERKRPYGKDETCCFCLDELELDVLQGDHTSHQWCPTCENLWHPDCYQKMKQYQERQRPPRAAACPFCRSVSKTVCMSFPPVVDKKSPS